ncbi:hypothetical protein C0993_006688 [Termitomyces sp. T159_Od127]|nr:hypothetical protein C0993_006688 [Termitomyces sp. T159_Od127]
MLRVAADCDEIPSSVITVVNQLGQNSKRHLRQRCEQFISLTANKDSLMEIVRQARSSSLPDFLAALSRPTVPPTNMTSSQSLSASKLRYDAYDAPISAPRLRDRDVSSSPLLTGPTEQWDVSSNTGRESLNRVSSKLPASSQDLLATPLTARELTLAASRQESGRSPEVRRLLNPLKASELPQDDAKTKKRFVEDLVCLYLFRLSRMSSNKRQASRADLISLDSPFVSVPNTITPESQAEEEFKGLWDSMEDGDARGWFSGSVDDVVERVRSLDVGLEMFPVNDLPYRGTDF